MKVMVLVLALPIFMSFFSFGCSETPREEFLTEGAQHSIPLDEIFDGGPGKDGIPALTNPRVVSAQTGNQYLHSAEIVLGVTFDGESRAYPIRIMNWHELVNDQVGGVSILVSYCPLCGTGIVFDSRINGNVHNFGVSGLLYNSDLLMYERGTEEPSLWAQLLGEAVVGPFTGTKLKLLPSVQTTWGEWIIQHPDTTVLDVNTGFSRDYRQNPYRGYDESSSTFFPVENRDNRLPSKEWVYGITVGDAHKAYKLESLKAKGVLNDSFAGTNLVLVAEVKSSGVRAFERANHTFTRKPTDLSDESGARWRLTEDALINTKTGEQLDRVQGVNAFWFGWVAFFPNTELFQ